MNFNKKKLIRIEEIVDMVKCNPLYSWEIRISGSVEFIGVVENHYGDKEWYKNGNLHRDNGPAIEELYGNKYWCKEGKLHRIDGPAVEYSDGTKSWYIEGNSYSLSEFERKKVCLGF